jgi:Fe-S oxidoreductase
MPHQATDPDQQTLDRALRYCITCPRMCRFACPVAHEEARETVTPWGLMSLLRMIDQGATPLDAEAAEVLTHCTGCRRCQGACVHDNPVPEALFEGRRRARDAGLSQPLPNAPPGLTAAEVAALGLPDRADEALWVAADERPDAAARAARIARLLRAFGVEAQWLPSPADAPQPTSGYGWLAAGAPDRADAVARALAPMMSPFSWVLTDSEQLLTLLASPRWQRPWVEAGLLPSRVLHWSVRLAEVLRRTTAPPAPYLSHGPALGRVAYHDACGLARLPTGPVLDAPRALLAWAFGSDAVRDLPDHGADALCCGHGAGYADQHPDRAQRLAHGILRDVARLGVRRLVSASPTCAAHLQAAAPDLIVQSLDEALTDALDAQQQQSP